MSATGAAPARRVRAPAARATRFFRSEVWLIFGRRRNWAGLAVLAVVPILIATSPSKHRR